MPNVDDRGRITIPKHLREELGLGPGTHVKIELQEGKLIIERKRTSEDIADRLRELVEDDGNLQREPEIDETDLHARRHRETVHTLAGRRDE